MMAQFVSLPFFSTAAFGITAMVLVGGSWCLTGFIMGDAPKRGIDPGVVQLTGNFFSLAASLIIMFATGSVPHCSFKILSLTCGALAIGGVLIIVMQQLMSDAMQKGPNGVVWAVIQSALIFPFLGGLIFFNMSVTWGRLLGIVLLLTALVFFALSKERSGKTGGGWKIPAFLSMVIAGIQQNFTAAPSYFEEARAVNSVVRTAASAAGGFVAVAICLLFRATPERRKIYAENFRSPLLWKYIAGMMCFMFVFSYLLFYPGMNAMADHDLGGMCYPMMVGSCIVTFTLLSFLFLKERITPVQAVGLVLCVTGLFFLCLPL